MRLNPLVDRVPCDDMEAFRMMAASAVARIDYQPAAVPALRSIPCIYSSDGAAAGY